VRGDVLRGREWPARRACSVGQASVFDRLGACVTTDRCGCRAGSARVSGLFDARAWSARRVCPVGSAAVSTRLGRRCGSPRGPVTTPWAVDAGVLREPHRCAPSPVPVRSVFDPSLLGGRCRSALPSRPVPSAAGALLLGTRCRSSRRPVPHPPRPPPSASRWRACPRPTCARRSTHGTMIPTRGRCAPPSVRRVAPLSPVGSDHRPVARAGVAPFRGKMVRRGSVCGPIVSARRCGSLACRCGQPTVRGATRLRAGAGELRGAVNSSRRAVITSRHTGNSARSADKSSRRRVATSVART
jgi:hypothetical protein